MNSIVFFSMLYVCHVLICLMVDDSDRRSQTLVFAFSAELQSTHLDTGALR
jgi:hypothetical protein